MLSRLRRLYQHVEQRFRLHPYDQIGGTDIKMEALTLAEAIKGFLSDDLSSMEPVEQPLPHRWVWKPYACKENQASLRHLPYTTTSIHSSQPTAAPPVIPMNFALLNVHKLILQVKTPPLPFFTYAWQMSRRNDWLNP